MTERHDLIAYLATLCALIVLEIAAFIAAAHQVSVTEAFGLGTITGGLIGVMRLPSRSTPARGDSAKAEAPEEQGGS